MKSEIKFFLYAFALGVAVVSYGHSTFSSKEVQHIIMDQLKTLNAKVDRILLRSKK